MTNEEVVKNLRIPKEKLKKYIEMEMIKLQNGMIPSSEVNHLLIIQLLEELGFSDLEIVDYLNYGDNSAYQKQELLLCKKRKEILEAIHSNEEFIMKIDYLIHETRKKGEENENN